MRFLVRGVQAGVGDAELHLPAPGGLVPAVVVAHSIGEPVARPVHPGVQFPGRGPHQGVGALHPVYVGIDPVGRIVRQPGEEEGHPAVAGSRDARALGQRDGAGRDAHPVHRVAVALLNAVAEHDGIVAVGVQGRLAGDVAHPQPQPGPAADPHVVVEGGRDLDVVPRLVAALGRDGHAGQPGGGDRRSGGPVGGQRDAVVLRPVVVVGGGVLGVAGGQIARAVQVVCGVGRARLDADAVVLRVLDAGRYRLVRRPDVGGGLGVDGQSRALRQTLGPPDLGNLQRPDVPHAVCVAPIGWPRPARTAIPADGVTVTHAAGASSGPWFMAVRVNTPGASHAAFNSRSAIGPR